MLSACARASLLRRSRICRLFLALPCPASPHTRSCHGPTHPNSLACSPPALNDGLPRLLMMGDEEEAESVFGNDDGHGAQAALQPALSAVASHLASPQTPALEKAAALDTGVVVDAAPEPDDRRSPPQQSPPPPEPLPSPWDAADPKDWVFPGSGDGGAGRGSRSRYARGVLEVALGSARHGRSRSAGQDPWSWKRLQKAMPSFQVSALLLPSLAAPFFSSSSSTSAQPRTGLPPSPPAPDPAPAPAATSASPPPLRRTTSDDSILYHSRSHTSSLGDDDRFSHVHEMVNMRLMALRDSLPDVPNFRMPSLPKIQAAYRKPPLLPPSPPPPSTTPPPAAATTSSSSAATSSKDAFAALDRVLADLTGDVVVLGGYRGSVLRSADPPHQQLWAPVKLGFNMRKANLTLGLDDDDEDRVEQAIVPSGMLQHIGPIDISRKLLRRLRACENARRGDLRVWDFGYDWRLSPHLLSRRLRRFLRTLPSNQPGAPPETRGALVVAHSLGGLITRHAVNGCPDLFRGVLYAGTPQRCINILGPMRNGDVVLFNDKLLSAAVNFSIRSSFVFLPEDGFCFVDRRTGEPYRVDFYDPDQWLRCRLSPCLQPPLPPHDRTPASPSFASFLPNPLRARADSRSGRRSSPDPALPHRDQHRPPTPASPSSPPEHPDCQRHLEYLARVLAATKRFRAELAHDPSLQAADAYPPFAVLYGKTIPTVYAAQVSGRDAIPCADAYDDLLFRAGDGVVLAKEAMLPDGYAVVRGGMVSTERGHITMLGDLAAIGKALVALVRGRRKGIGLRRNAAARE